MDKDKEEVDNTKKYKIKHCKKLNPFSKWVFSKRGLKSISVSVVLFLFIIMFNIFYLIMNYKFADLPFALNVLSPIIMGGVILNVMEFSANFRSIIKGDRAFKKKNIIDNFTLSAVLMMMYIINFFIFFGLSLLIGPSAIGASLVINYLFSMYLNWEIDITDDASILKLGKDDMREMRLEQILGKK